MQGAAALAKAMQVLDLVADAATPPTFADLVVRSGLPRGTLHRLLAAWQASDMISLSPERHYRPGVHLLTLARRTWERMDVRIAASAAMQRLNALTGETVQLAVLSGDAVVWLEKLECNYPLRLHSAVGGRGPVHCTAVGKAMAAFLEPRAQKALIARLDLVRHTGATLTTRARLREALREIRQTGIAFDLEEHREGVHCVAAPVLDFRESSVGAISVTALRSRTDLRVLRSFAPLLREAAAEAGRALGGAAAGPLAEARR